MSARKHEYFKTCQACGADKPWTKNRKCRVCAHREQMEAIRKNTYYENCATCGERKPRTRRPNCKRCGGLKSALTLGRTGHTYDVCSICGGNKPRNSSTKCLGCSIEDGTYGRHGLPMRHNVHGRTIDPVEAEKRQREAHQCARMLRARIAARFRPGVPMNRASLREMFAPDREEGEAA